MNTWNVLVGATTAADLDWKSSQNIAETQVEKQGTRRPQHGEKRTAREPASTVLYSYLAMREMTSQYFQFWTTVVVYVQYSALVSTVDTSTTEIKLSDFLDPAMTV